MVTVPCELCGTPTPMTSTKRCDRCWELERRIESSPDLAEKILTKIRTRRQDGVTEKNFPAFKKAYKQAAKDHLITFQFEGTEVLTEYAKYVVEYLGTKYQARD